MSFDNPILERVAPTYRDVREALLSLAERTPMTRITPHLVPGKDEKGNELYCDEIYFGPQEPACLLVLDSGIHGIEGFATAAQCYEALRMAPYLLRNSPIPTGLLIIGVINPHGLVERNRFNANNVDLNRNFVHFPLDYRNKPYRRLYHAINPESVEFMSECWHKLKVWLARRQKGFSFLVEAIGSGQWEHSKGVQFGGFSPERENVMLCGMMRALPASVRKLIWVNLHCGLGAYGKGAVLDGYRPESAEGRRVRAHFGDLLPPANFINTNPNGFGAIDSAVIEEVRAANPAAEVTVFAFETGTYDIATMVWAVRARNWARHFGARDEGLVERIKERMLSLFYPTDPAWRGSLQAEGRKIVAKSLLSFLDRRNPYLRAASL